MDGRTNALTRFYKNMSKYENGYRRYINYYNIFNVD